MADIRSPRNIGDILNQLNNARCEGKGWQADCPVVGHKTPRNHLHIEDCGDKAVVTCFGTGHTYEQIAEAIGFDTLTYSHDIIPTTPKIESRIVATYDYIDKDRKLLYQVVRMEPKDFRQRRPDGTGGWIWDLKGIEPILFCLPDIHLAALTGDDIYIVEGEKDALNLWNIGLVATCNSGGAGKWKPEYSETLRYGHIIIIPDSDMPGYNHAQKVALSLYGIANSIKILRIPEPHKDISDWLSANLNINENWLSDWDTLVAAAADYTPEYRFPPVKSEATTIRGAIL